MTILKPPVFCPIRHDFKIEAVTVKQLLRLIPRLSFLALKVRQVHFGGISLGAYLLVPPKMPPILPAVSVCRQLYANVDVRKTLYLQSLSERLRSSADVYEGSIGAGDGNRTRTASLEG